MSSDRHSEVVPQVAEQFAKAFWRMRRGSRRELAPFGLTFSQARALRVLARAGAPMRVGDLAAKLEIVPRSATTMVDVLETAGLARRSPDPSDRRSVLVSPTEAGTALHERVQQARRESAEALFDRLDDAQLSDLLALLTVLNAPGPEAAPVRAGAGPEAE